MTSTLVVYYVVFALAAVGLVVFIHWLDRRDDVRYGRLVDRLPQPKRGPNRRR